MKSRNLFYKAILPLSILILFSITTFAKKNNTDIKIPQVTMDEGVYYVVLDAPTYYGRGYQHGKALKPQINNALKQFKDWLATTAKIEDPEKAIQEFASSTPYLAAVKKTLPNLYKEMEGIAKGAGVDLNQLFVYQSFDEFFVYLFKNGNLKTRPDGHCTTVAIKGENKRSNYVGHNNDIPPYHQGLVTVLHIKNPEAKVEILQGTFAGGIGQNGVNNHGVGVGINTIANLPSGNGIPVSFNVRKILQQKNLDDAIRYLKSASFAQAMNYMIIDKNALASVETWENNAKVVDIFKGNYAIHTNHTLLSDMPVTFELEKDSGGGSFSNTLERYNKGLEILSTKNNMTLIGFKRLFNMKPILVYPGTPTGKTITNTIVEIAKDGPPVLYITSDSPNKVKHASFSFEG